MSSSSQDEQQPVQHPRLIPLQAVPIVPRQGYYRKREQVTDFVPLISLSGLRRARSTTITTTTNQKPALKPKAELENRIENNTFKNDTKNKSSSSSSSSVAVVSDASTYSIADASSALGKEIRELQRFRLDLKPTVDSQDKLDTIPKNDMAKVAQEQISRFAALEQLDSRFGGEDFFRRRRGVSSRVVDHSCSKNQNKETELIKNDNANSNKKIDKRSSSVFKRGEGFFHPDADATVLNVRWVLEPADLVLADSDWLRLQDGPDDILAGNSTGPRHKSKHLPYAKVAHARWSKLLKLLRENAKKNQQKKKAESKKTNNKKTFPVGKNKSTTVKNSVQSKVSKPSRKKLMKKRSMRRILKRNISWSCEIYCYVTSPLSVHGAHWLPLRILKRYADPVKNKNLLISLAREIESCAAELMRRKLVMGVELLRIGAAHSPEPADLMRREAIWAWYSCGPADGSTTLFEEAGKVKDIIFSKRNDNNNDNNKNINDDEDAVAGQKVLAGSKKSQKNYHYYSEADVLRPDSVIWPLQADFWKVPVELLQGKVRVQDAGGERAATIAAVVQKSRSLGRVMSPSELLNFPTRQL